MSETKFTPLFSVNYELRNLVERDLQQMTSVSTALDGLASYALGKGHKTHEALLLLCDKGFGQDAAILARSLWEIKVILLYVLQEDPEQRARMYMSYDHIQRLKQYKYIADDNNFSRKLKGREPKGGLDGLQKMAALAQKEFGDRNNNDWSNKKIFGMAKAIGLESEYNTIYKLLCDVAHSGSRTMNDYITDNGEGFIIEVGASEALIEVSLVSGFDSYYHIVQGWQKVFSIDSSAGLKTIEEKYAALSNIADRENKMKEIKNNSNSVSQ